METKLKKQIQTGFLSVGPTIFEWWVMETPKSKQPLSVLVVWIFLLMWL